MNTSTLNALKEEQERIMRLKEYQNVNLNEETKLKTEPTTAISVPTTSTAITNPTTSTATNDLIEFDDLNDFNASIEEVNTIEIKQENNELLHKSIDVISEDDEEEEFLNEENGNHNTSDDIIVLDSSFDDTIKTKPDSKLKAFFIFINSVFISHLIVVTFTCLDVKEVNNKLYVTHMSLSSDDDCQIISDSEEIISNTKKKPTSGLHVNDDLNMLDVNGKMFFGFYIRLLNLYLIKDVYW